MRARAATAAAGAAAVAAAAAPAAHAAAPWSDPQTLSAAHQFVDPVALAFAADGAGLASWTYQDGTDAHATTGADAATRAAGAAAFGAQRRLIAPHRTDRGAVLVGTVAFGRSRALRVTVVRRHVDPRRPDAFALRAATGTTGALGPARLVATGPQMLRATVAANARGDAAIAWWERARRSRLYVAVKRRGHGFEPPQRLAPHGFGDVALAVGPRGDVLATWEDEGVVRARTRAPGGRQFGAAMVVTRRRALRADLEAALSRRGRVVVAWGAQFRDEGGAGPVTYAAAIRRPGGDRFGVTVLERQRSSVIAQPVRLAMDRSGRATFAWTGWDGSHSRVRAATADPDAPFSAPQDLSAAGQDAELGGVASRTGRRAVAWTVATPGDEGAIEVAWAGIGASLFGAPELVSPGPGARVPQVAIDPSTGRATVVWSERSVQGPGIPQTVARTATRGSVVG